MSAMAYQITGASIAYSTICSGADQVKHQNSALLAFVRGITNGEMLVTMSMTKQQMIITVKWWSWRWNDARDNFRKQTDAC